MRAISIAICLVMMAAPAGADHVGIYDSTVNLSCTAIPQLFYPVSVFVVHRQTAGSEGSAFRIAANLPPAVAVTGYTTLNCDLGFCNPYEGVYVTYGGCLTGDILACRLDFFFTGPADGSCNHLSVVPHPNEADVVTFDCNSNPVIASGGFLSFVSGPGQCECTVATEQTTWGRVKSLYR